MKSLFVLLSVLTSILQGCSSASGSLFKEIERVPDGQSLVYLYRPDDEKGTIFDIECNNQAVGTIERSGYFAFFVPPGKNVISSTVRFKLFSSGLLDASIVGSTEFVFKADAGQTYFVECLANQAQGQKLSIASVPEKYGRIRIRDCHLLEIEQAKE